MTQHKLKLSNLLETYHLAIARRLNNRPTYSSFVIVAILMFFLLVFIQPVFDTNDDIAMMFISNGYYYGSPSEHLIFTNIIIGLLLKFLYTTVPCVSWYPIYLYFFHFISFFLLLSVIFLSKKDILQFCVLLYIIFLFELYMLMNLQFTSTSLNLGFSSILYYLVATKQRKANKWNSILAGVLLGTTGIIRTNSFVGALIFGFPLLLHGFKCISWKKTSLFSLIALGIFFGASVTNSLYYNFNPDWQDYFEFNKVRGSLHGTPKMYLQEEDKSNLLKKINWSKNDYAMFDNWFYTDRERFSTNALKTLAKQSNSELSFKDNLDTTIDSFRIFNESLKGKIIYIFTILCILLTLASKTRKYFLLSCVVWNLLVIFYLMNYVRFPPRVGVPLFLFISFFSLILSEISFSSFLQKKLFSRRPIKTIAKTIILFLAVFILIFKPIQEIVYDSHKNAVKNQQFISLLERLRTVNPEGIFVVWGSSLKYEYCSPFITVKQLPKLKLIGLGWRVNSPSHRESLKKLKIDDLYQAIANRDDVYFIASENLITLYEKYMLEHYGRIIKLRSFLTIDDFGADDDESEPVRVFHRN